jgi:hypothetical protein
MTQKTRRRYHRVLSAAESQGLSPAMFRQLRAQGVLPPIAGGAPDDGSDDAGTGGGKPKSGAKTGDDDGDDDSDDADDDADDDDDDDEPAASKGKEGKEGKTRAASDDDNDSDGYVRMPRSEVQRLRREARDARKSIKQREREDRERREKDLADNEKWKDLAESREDRITELEGEVEALKMEKQKDEHRASIVKVAKRLNFEYPDDAHRFLDSDDMEDEQSIESALKTVLRDRPKLKSKRKGSGAPISDDDGDRDGKGGQLTMEDIKKMSPKEVNDRWEEVQAVLKSAEVAAS